MGAETASGRPRRSRRNRGTQSWNTSTSRAKDTSEHPPPVHPLSLSPVRTHSLAHPVQSPTHSVPPALRTRRNQSRVHSPSDQSHEPGRNQAHASLLLLSHLPRSSPVQIVALRESIQVVPHFQDPERHPQEQLEWECVRLLLPPLQLCHPSSSSTRPSTQRMPSRSQQQGLRTARPCALTRFVSSGRPPFPASWAARQAS